MGARATSLFEEVNIIPADVLQVAEILSVIVLDRPWWRVVYGVRL